MQHEDGAGPPSLESVSADDKKDAELTAKDMLAAGRDHFNRREVLEMLGEVPLDYPELGSRLVEAMTQFTPTIPDPVLDHILARSGFQTTDPNVYSSFFFL
jgi:hypothetical protein